MVAKKKILASTFLFLSGKFVAIPTAAESLADLRSREGVGEGIVSQKREGERSRNSVLFHSRR